MNFFEKLEKKQKENNSLVCVGLDADTEKIPEFLKSELDPLFAFNKAIIDTTIDFVCSYKLNLAFFEAMGLDGLVKLRKIVDYIHSVGALTVLDGKRNDIGNSSTMYAKGIFDELDGDSITVSPYMGQDSVEPFLNFSDKGVFVLVKTSNPGGKDFQDLICEGEPLYLKVAKKVIEWNKNNNAGFVVGATYPEELALVRKIAPNTTFLVPGVGAQGGNLEATIKQGQRTDGLGLIIVSARGIIYASKGEDFAERAREEAMKLRDEINRYR